MTEVHDESHNPGRSNARWRHFLWLSGAAPFPLGGKSERLAIAGTRRPRTTGTFKPAGLSHATRSARTAKGDTTPRINVGECRPRQR